jgi:hypothetical protein
VDVVIELCFPAGDEGPRLRARRRAPIQPTSEDVPSGAADIRKAWRHYYNDAGAASAVSATIRESLDRSNRGVEMARKTLARERRDF